MNMLTRFLETQKYLGCANAIIMQAENPALPSCKSILMLHIKQNFKKSPLKSRPKDTSRSSSILVYEIARTLLDSAKYRDSMGFLFPQGEQLLHICRWSLTHFDILGYISEEDLSAHRAFLDECENNPVPYRVW